MKQARASEQRDLLNLKNEKFIFKKKFYFKINTKEWERDINQFIFFKEININNLFLKIASNFIS